MSAEPPVSAAPRPPAPVSRQDALEWTLRLVQAAPQMSQALSECLALVTRLFAYFGIPANTDLTEAAALIEAEHERRVADAAGPNVGPLVITKRQPTPTAPAPKAGREDGSTGPERVETQSRPDAVASRVAPAATQTTDEPAPTPAPGDAAALVACSLCGEALRPERMSGRRCAWCIVEDVERTLESAGVPDTLPPEDDPDETPLDLCDRVEWLADALAAARAREGTAEGRLRRTEQFMDGLLFEMREPMTLADAQRARGELTGFMHAVRVARARENRAALRPAGDDSTEVPRG